jgi:hypothetical protein
MKTDCFVAVPWYLQYPHLLGREPELERGAEELESSPSGGYRFSNYHMRVRGN